MTFSLHVLFLLLCSALQRSLPPWEPTQSIMHPIKNAYLCLCLFDGGTPMFHLHLRVMHEATGSARVMPVVIDFGPCASPWRQPLWHQRASALWPCQSLNRCSPASSHLACREHFLWHLVIRLQWSLLAASQLNDDPVVHIEPAQRTGAPYWERRRESKCWLGMDA